MGPPQRGCAGPGLWPAPLGGEVAQAEGWWPLDLCVGVELGVSAPALWVAALSPCPLKGITNQASIEELSPCEEPPAATGQHRHNGDVE